MNSTRIRAVLAVAIGCTVLVAGGVSVANPGPVDTHVPVGSDHGSDDGGDANVTLDSIGDGANASYGASLPVAGEATVDGDPIDEVPIEVALADEELGAVETTDGEFDGSVSVPASVPAGEHDLAVTLGVEDRAIESATNVSVTVHETESRLAIDAVPAEDGVRIGGVLTTSDGVPVADQSVELAVDDETVATVTTGSDGEFETTEPVSSTSADATVVATYGGVDSSLDPAEDATTVDASVAGSSSDATGWSVAMYALGGVGALVVLVAGWALVRYLRARRRRSRTHSVLRRRSGNGRVTSRSSYRSPAASQGSRTRSVSTGEPLSHSLLSQASEELSNGRTNAAVRSAYAAVRFELQSTVGDSRTCTHWEFARRYRGPGTDDLERLTERYEVAAFDHGTVPVEHARQTLRLARRLIDLRDDTGDVGASTDGVYGSDRRDRGITIVE